jgi:ABC-type Fe3+/spermidine/putrescine transport system ATPase subunit
MAPILIRGLSKRFGGGEAGVAAVETLDLDIKDNQFVTLLGPSGCGKTTTLRLIAGYITPDAGTIEVAGSLMSSPATVVPPQERGMGMVFQNYAVWPHKTVFQNVVFGLRLRKLARGEARQKVEHMLALVNLAGLGSRYPAELSSGSRSHARWWSSPASCCSTSPCPISTPSCASACAASSRSCSAGPASPSCMSPTTRPRRSRSPTRSRS